MNKKELIPFLIGSAVIVILILIFVFSRIGTEISKPEKISISEGSAQTTPVSAIETAIESTEPENVPSSSAADVQPNGNETGIAEYKVPVYYYDVDKVAFGDSIGGMKIKELKNSGYAVDSGNLEFLITFEGEFEVTGTLSVLEMTNECCFHNDEFISDFLPFSSFEAEIEKNKNHKLEVFFYIINEDELHNEISKLYKDYEKGQQVNLEVIFSEYSFCIYGFNFEHWVQFKELIEVF